MRLLKPLLLSACIALASAACGKKTADETAAGGSPDALPAPAAAGGSVTGMPDKPGPGDVDTSGDAAPPPDAVAGDAAIDPLNPETGLLPGDAEPADPQIDAPVGEPTAQDAVAVIRDYYAAINGRSHARAYSLWSDGGGASGQSPQQFADGFADTVGVTVQIGAPGAVDAAAGSRFIEVPVTVNATHADGSTHRYLGRYVLRHAVVDGATAEQRAWRIASADLREEKP